MTAYHQVADKWVGIATKSKLIIRPKSEDVLLCKISNTKYAEVNMTSPQNWYMENIDNQLQYEELPTSGKTFEVQLKNGLVHSLIVDQSVDNKEVNCIKSIMSQFQINTQGKNLIKSKYNELPENDQVNAYYKTMEVCGSKIRNENSILSHY